MANKNLVQPEYTLPDGSSIVYSIRKSKKAKRIQLRIVNRTLELIVPFRISTVEGIKFLSRRGEWLQKHRRLLTAGESSFHILGEEIKIERSSAETSRYSFNFGGNVLSIICPEGSDIPLNKLFNVFRKNYARKWLPARVSVIAGRYGFSFSRLSIRSQKTRWGSCSAKGTITLNERLMEYKPEVIDYVIIHELCHTRYMNHSEKFWNLVAAYCPDYKACRRILKHR